MLSSRTVALAVACLASTAFSQSNSRIVGLTESTPLLRSQDVVNCSPSFCAPAGFPSTVSAVAGGTAYDTRTRGTWITNGVVLAKVDSRDSCVYQCAPTPLAIIDVSTRITGLAYVHRTNRLLMTDSGNGISTWQINGCGVTMVSRCVVPLPTGNILTGIAVDDVTDQLFYCYSNFALGAPTVPGGMVAAASLLDPCQPGCAAPATFCTNNQPLGALRGLGYDACTNQLWITDGFRTISALLSPATCQLTVTGCCPNQVLAGEPYVGLCIEPSTEDSVGQSCTNGSCPNCAPVHFMAHGDPVLGNLGFTLDGTQLPANTMAATFFNFGPCNNAGILVQPFCGPLHVALTPTLLAFPQPTGGGAGCSGTTSLQVSIAADPQLCGTVISSQVLGICVNAVSFGTYVSNCLSWEISSS